MIFVDHIWTGEEKFEQGSKMEKDLFFHLNDYSYIMWSSLIIPTCINCSIPIWHDNVYVFHKLKQLYMS